jgi:hypothetical protein
MDHLPNINGHSNQREKHGEATGKQYECLAAFLDALQSFNRPAHAGTSSFGLPAKTAGTGGQ